MELASYFKAGFPVLYMCTPEESRAELIISDIAKELKWNVVTWSFTDKFEYMDNRPLDIENKEDPIEALQVAKETSKKKTIWIFKDLHKFFSAPMVIRLIRDICTRFKQNQNTLILLSPIREIPPDIEHDVSLIEFELPDKEEITRVWKRLCADNPKINSMADTEQVVDAGMGLTVKEAENVFAKAVIDHVGSKNKTPVVTLVLREKAQAIKKSGTLEYYEATESKDDVGGLDNLKSFLLERGKAFTKKARDWGLPKPRGIVLVGLPGTGKSLIAKAASNIMGVPLVRFDLGRVFGGLVGASEQNVRNATKTIDALGTCCVWLDEMEKAFAGAGSGGSNDSGVTDRVVGHLLTWMQEKTSPSFVIATVNRIENILQSMPEMLRKGRFDDIFMVGLPSIKEREEILRIHVQKSYNRRSSDIKGNKEWTSLDIKYDELARESDGFSGAELAEAVTTGLYKAFYRDDELKTDYILHGIVKTVPLSKSAASQLKSMLDWATDNATPASSQEASVKGRKLEV